VLAPARPPPPRVGRARPVPAVDPDDEGPVDEGPVAVSVEPAAPPPKEGRARPVEGAGEGVSELATSPASPAGAPPPPRVGRGVAADAGAVVAGALVAGAEGAGDGAAGGGTSATVSLGLPLQPAFQRANAETPASNQALHLMGNPCSLN
jgi:hypothetical protein